MSEVLAKPPHYRDDDMKMIAEIEAFIANEDKKDKTKRISQANLAKLARVSPTTLSRILKRTYPSSPHRQLRAVVSAMQDRKQGIHDLSKTQETSIYKTVRTVCVTAREERTIGIVAGYVGLGKTHALKDYQAKHSNTILIEVTPLFNKSTLISKVEMGLFHTVYKGPLADRFEAVCDELKSSDCLLIFDEAETLSNGVLELTRRLRDNGEVGVVLSGTAKLTSLIKPVGGVFDQARSRVGFWPETMRKLEYQDVVSLTEAYLGEEISTEAMGAMWRISRGSARMIAENIVPKIIKYRPQFKEMDSDELPKITADMIAKIARQTLQVTESDI